MQHLVPGDIVDIVIAGDQAFGDKNAADRLRRELNLDRPIAEQYVLWLGRALRGDLGTSFVSGREVTGEILRRLPVNLELTALAIGFALLLGIPIGALSAVRSDTVTDAAVRFGSVLGYSIPNFWVATLTVLLGSLYFPRMPILQFVPLSVDPVRNLTLLLIPSFVLSLTVLPLVVRMTRASMLENLRLDYVRTARAKGLAERRVVFRHVLANSLIAVLNVTGVQVGILIGIPVGALSAVRSGSWTDAAVRFGSVLGYSIPNFWAATLTVLLGSLYFPRMPILQYVAFSTDPVRNLTLLVIPSFVLSLTVLPLIVRMTRASMLENLRLDYVRTARAKGLAERSVVFRHVLANSLIAVLNVTGVQVGILIGGLVLTEEIFILPGVGRFLLDSIQKRDFPVITGTTLFLATAFVCVNLLVDLLHDVLDPRIRR